MKAHESGRLTDSVSAAAEMLNQLRGSLYGYAFLLCGQPDEAEDLVQEAFARVLAAHTTLTSVRSPAAYLRRSVTNVFLERGRRTTLWNRRLPALFSPLRLRDPADDVAMRDQVDRGLRRLSNRQRAAIVLRYYADLDFAEIGQVLGCPATSARSLTARGLSRMRVNLNTDDGGRQS